MPEYIQEGHWKKASPGAMLDNTIVRRDLFHLLAVFMADRRVQALVHEDELPRVPDLWNEFTIGEIELRLASTASFLRARDDYITRRIEELDTEGDRSWAKALQEQPCGSLQPDVTTADEVPLIFREACNKIIHAIEYRFCIEDLGEPHSYVNPFVYLYGEAMGGKKKPKRWRAVLDILRYVEIGARYTEFT
jgi:hypothetical protein